MAGLAIVGSRAVADAPRWLAAVGVPLVALGGVVALSGRRRFLAAQRAMRVGEPLPPPRVANALPVGLVLVAALALVAAVADLAWPQ